MKKILVTILCILISSLSFIFSDGLSGQLGFLQWIAPVPLLILSLSRGGGQVFIISFITAFVGRLGWLKYLGSLMPFVPAFIIVTMLAVSFAAIVILTRLVMKRVQSWYTVFAFPVFFTAYEFLLSRFSYDGTAASIAYSQADFLPLVQIASVTGIAGITFIVTFISSFLALIWYYRRNKNYLFRLIITGILITGSVLIYGWIRLSGESKGDLIPVALIVLNEDSHKFELKDNQFETEHAEKYAEAISRQASQGAKLIVLPERALNVNPEIDSPIFSILSHTARKYSVTLVTGYSNYKNEKPANSAWVIDEKGKLLCDYDKVHLVKGLEQQFMPGTKPATFGFMGIKAGTAICKDLDYPSYIARYNKVELLCVPAWDFSVDGWLHSRMAILRGVENGFSEIRTARTGRLTISNPYGRVTAEASSEEGREVVLNGLVNTRGIKTIYPQTGNWSGIVLILGAVIFSILSIRKRFM